MSTPEIAAYLKYAEWCMALKIAPASIQQWSKTTGEVKPMVVAYLPPKGK